MTENSSPKKVIVIGGGPAGLMAAGQAARNGAETILFEKMNQTGRKLRITGKGRCNLTNVAPIPDFIEHFGRNGKFLRQVFSRFFSEELIEFFNHLGVETVVERGGRVFPASGSAPEVAAALLAWVRESGVRIITGARAEELIVRENRLVGLNVFDMKTKQTAQYEADAIIIAAGGKSYPGTGSTGDGYRLAKSVGHTIVPVLPALVPLEIAGKSCPRLKGLTLRNVEVTVFTEEKMIGREFGEMEFEEYGVTGPIILSLSRFVVDAISEKRNVTLSINLKPALDAEKLDARLLRELDSNGKNEFQKILTALLPARLIPVCLDAVQILPQKPCSQISAEERKRLRRWLHNFTLLVTGYRPFSEALVTAGGVDLSDVYPRTLESRILNGLYFAGEVLNVDADTGGYNLQAAFSTGYVAGLSAAEFRTFK